MRALVHLDKLHGDGESEAGPAVLARGCAVKLPEFVEDAGVIRRINADTGITDAQSSPK
jgi:hypothetical protein